MAGVVARRLIGLLSPLAASASPLSRHFSHLRPSAAAVRTPVVPILAQSPRFDLLQRVSALVPNLTQQPCRTLTYFSLKKGKRKSVKSVPDRFMRLHCGLWIRRKAGYKKKLWNKLPARRKRLREIVFCNKSQSKLLDKMTTSFWKRRNWYVDDPYLKYHDRVNLKV
ncbi:unnamed protein product [Ophioblennius macclurei]